MRAVRGQAGARLGSRLRAVQRDAEARRTQGDDKHYRSGRAGPLGIFLHDLTWDSMSNALSKVSFDMGSPLEAH
mgnify:CR=1 FL=1